MKRIAALAFAAFCLLFLCGCWNGRVLFAFEQPFWAARDGGSRLALPLVEASLTHGYLPRILVSGQAASPAERLAAAVTAGRYRAVVVGPPLSFDWRVYAPLQPRTRFILIGGGAVADELPPNIVTLLYERRAAFRAAGIAAGISVRGGSGGPGIDGLGARIAVLLSAAPSLDTGETEAFSEGAARALDGARPSIRVLDERIDKPAVKTALETMHRDGVQLFLLGMGALDAWGLEVLQGTGGAAIVADWAASGAFPGQVFLSVEEDIPGGIARALASPSRLRSINGPVRLVSGRARPVPREVESYRENE